MRNPYSKLALCVALVCALCFPQHGLAQTTFTGSRGFAPTFKTLQDTPAPGVDLSIQVPGNVELNGCASFVYPSVAGSVCLCGDATVDQIFHDTDCSGDFTAGDFYLSGEGGGGGTAYNLSNATPENPFTLHRGGDDSIKQYIDDDGIPRWEATCDGLDCNTEWLIASGNTFSWCDGSYANCGTFTLDPGNETPNLRWRFKAGYEPLVSTEVVLRPAGNCTVAEAAIVTNAPLEEWATCADTTGDSFAFSYTATTKIAGDATATLTMTAVNLNATPTGTFTLQCAAQSIRPGIDAYAAHSTTGQQPVSFTTFDTQNRPEQASATFTINGTVAVGAHIMGQCNVSAVPTQVADIRLKGTATLELAANSLSD